MNLATATQIAHELMSKHGLIAQGWIYKQDNAVRRFGQCSYSRKTISQSQKYILINDEQRVRDNMLHEIAHALTPNHHHDHVWKAKCREIGATPRRCHSDENTVLVPSKYEAHCHCGKVYKRHKKPTRVSACKCQRPKKFADMDKLVWIDTRTNQVVTIHERVRTVRIPSATWW